MDGEREPERSEVYERIPWDMLEPKRGDRQWLVLAVAGALVAGALAYSVVSRRPTAPVPAVSETPPSPTTSPSPAAPAAVDVPAAAPPAVTAEADLYAVDPERMIDRAASHAEWFVAEYLTYDGSEASGEILAGLMPGDLPSSAAPDGTRVFVEWVRAMSVEEVAPLLYEVDVLARTLAARDNEPYVRQRPLLVTVDVSVSSGSPTVVEPPRVTTQQVGPATQLSLSEVPEDRARAAVETLGEGQVLGGVPEADGGWRVVVMAPGPDGVSRPQTVEVP